MKGPRKTLLASSILAIPTLAQALGLGGIEVKSGLNEPLVAEIQVIQSAPGEADGLAVALASAEDFQRVGIDRARIDTPLNFSVGKGKNGQAIIKVTTATPVREPFLNFLVEINWSKGRLLREYTVLLDPPVSAPARGGTQVATAPVRETVPVQPAPAEVKAAPTPPKPQPEPVRPAPEPTPAAEPAPMAAEPAAPTEAAPPEAAPAAAPGDYGPIGQGETLWEIARATKPGGVSDMNKFMIALLRMNPNAFYEQNINALKRGAILRIPTDAEINAIATSEAAEAVKSQNELWRGYQGAQAARPTQLADAGASESLRTPAAGGSDKGSRLELLPPRAGDDQGAADRPGSSGLDRSGEEVKNLRGDLARAQEDLESSRQEVSELRSRVGDLEKIKTDQEKVLSLRNDELKALQSRAKELEARIRELEAAAAATPATSAQPTEAAPDIWKAPDQPPAEPSTTPPADTQPAEPAPSTDTPPADTSVPADSTVPTDTAPPADTTPAPTETTPTDSTAAVQPVTEPAPAEPTPVEPAPADTTPAPAADGGLMSNPYVLGGIGAAGLALLALLWSRLRRKSAPKDQGFAAGPASDDHTDFFPKTPSAITQETDLGDSIEEALLDQIAMNPADLRTRVDLLRYYQERGNAAEFENAARALRAQIASEEQPEWKEAAALAASILPGHPLFARKDEIPPAASYAEADLGPVDEPLEGGLDLADFDDAKPAASAAPAAPADDNSFDFDFDLDTPTQAVAPVAAPAPVAVPEPAPAPAATSSDHELSFDFDLDIPAPAPKAPEPAPVAAPQPAPAPAPAPVEAFKLDLPEIDFAALEEPKQAAARFEAPAPVAAPSMDDELGDLGVFGDDAVATKLDLARAYMDMGDPDGARSMLEEVIGEGNAAQQDEARKLLDSLR